MARPIWLPISGLKIAVGLISIGTLWLAGETTFLSVLGRGEQNFALSLENGARPKWSEFSAIDRTGEVGAYANTCNRDLLRATASIRLAAFDAARSSGTETDRAKTAGDADLALRVLLHCNPIDGNAWLKLASVDANTLGGNDLDRQLIMVSQWATPNEGWILRPRITLEVLLLNAGLERIADALRSDIRRMAETGKDKEIALLYAAGASETRTVFEAEIALMPKERQETLRASIDAVTKSAASAHLQ